MKTTITFSVIILMCVLPGFTYAQLINISGHVTNALTKTGIENVSVFEKRSETGTISNKEGYFKLTLYSGHQSILFSENGYKTFSENIVLKSDTTINVRLKPEITSRNRRKNNSDLQAAVKK